jgi:O-antigen/teichoic acid export membrane protein
VIYICLPVLVVMIIFPSQVIFSIFGNNYIAGYTALTVLAYAQLINIVTGPADQVLMMTGHQVDMLWISISMFVVNIIANGLLIPIYGIVGAAIATMITYGGVSILSIIRVKMKLGFWPYDRTLIKGAIACIAIVAVMFFIRNMSFNPGIIELTLKVIISYLLFALVLWALRLENEEKQLLRMVYRMISR